MQSNKAYALVSALDRFSRLTGQAVSWLTLAMVLVSCTVVLMRYVFDFGWIWVQESVTWMHAMVFMIGASYTLEREDHVRVDIFFRKMSPRNQALVNIVGVLVLLLPTAMLILWSSSDYVMAAWRVKETSQEAGGLPALYLLKAVMPLAAILLAMQGVSLLLRNVLVLAGVVDDHGSAGGSNRGEG
jgi:TRAP-type mannitol/chloroaromatic compound transport system permease small subunit